MTELGARSGETLDTRYRVVGNVVGVPIDVTLHGL